MATYCISDVHGCYDQFIKMLSQINFKNTDQLYILGDIIDRGPQSAEMLWFATKEAPANIHFLLGNHEDMMLAAASNYKFKDSIHIRLHDSWSYNKGAQTLEQIHSFKNYSKEWEKKILKWMCSLPLYYDVIVKGRRFLLVHAGLQAKDTFPDDFCPNGVEKSIKLIGVEQPQSSQAMLWNRMSWLTEKDMIWPFNIVSGHTPVTSVHWEEMEHYGIPHYQNVENGIVHFGKDYKKHLIDCGCCKGKQLACLRLDDMQEFYVPGIEKKSKHNKTQW